MKEELESLTPEQKKELQTLLKKSSPPKQKSSGKTKKQDSEPEPGKPTWFKEHKIIEIPFCEEFLKSHPIVCVHGQFYDFDGRVDEEQLKQEMLSVIRPYVGVNVARKLDQLVKAMKTVALIKEFPVQTDRVHVRNGTLFLNGEFRAEKEFCVYRLPVSYNPAAAPPKTWLAFLNELLFEEDIRAFQEFLGYIFLPTNKGQVMMLLIGKGGEGKSRIGLVLHSLLGDSMNFGSIVKLATDRFNPADQEGKLLLFDDDMRTDALTDTGTLKAIITAEGKFDLERKGRQSFQGDLFVRLLALSNGSLSALYDRSDAFYRRQLVIRVRERPEDRVDDPRIAEKMIAEKTGPHFAFGDTCYSYEEDTVTYNPDGKAIIARSNEISDLRKTSPEKAYFGCHTDITIPFEELAGIWAVTASREEIPVIEDGLFAVPGTEDLNAPLLALTKK